MRACAAGMAATQPGDALAAVPTPRSRAEPPNIVLIVADDLGYGDLSSYGHKVLKTPALDRLASEGVRLTSFYAASPLCSPSRAAMMTGRTPFRTGIESWIPENTATQLGPREVTVATLLRDRGYQTFLSGKWHLNGGLDVKAHTQPNDHGFEHWLALHAFAIPHHKNPSNFFRDGKRPGRDQGVLGADRGRRSHRVARSPASRHPVLPLRVVSGTARDDRESGRMERALRGLHGRRARPCGQRRRDSHEHRRPRTGRVLRQRLAHGPPGGPHPRAPRRSRPAREHGRDLHQRQRSRDPRLASLVRGQPVRQRGRVPRPQGRPLRGRHPRAGDRPLAGPREGWHGRRHPGVRLRPVADDRGDRRADSPVGSRDRRGRRLRGC